jgi:hypothetical protein
MSSAVAAGAAVSLLFFVALVVAAIILIRRKPPGMYAKTGDQELTCGMRIYRLIKESSDFGGKFGQNNDKLPQFSPTEQVNI